MEQEYFDWQQEICLECYGSAGWARRGRFYFENIRIVGILLFIMIDPLSFLCLMTIDNLFHIKLQLIDTPFTDHHPNNHHNVKYYLLVSNVI